MKKLFFAFLFLALFAGVEGFAKSSELQKNKGFVGYVEAGTVVEIKSISLETQTLNFIAPNNLDVGTLQATFKNFERALGGGKKVDYLHKVEPLPGRSFTLKHNLVLLSL
ncbi:hypothetical protein AZI86_18400 [Bdellovibrio bacteriovorus]|uniref:Uncharacterized protein n=1 Tax=Bdellovibrio bacteriovorus TaxID=959 RepID=A0A150WF66_BDEBC|nr:hypothetical protein [Bdellovibrio bacteriovorus]KYG61666.1 hypothetical protein AZI86_18400 [Bdellovibrio bacteriovorus]